MVIGRAFLAMAALLSVGCTRQELDSSLVGTFKLQSRDGQPLPAPTRVTFQGQDCINELHSSFLTISPDGTWSELTKAEHRCDAENGETRTFGPHAFEANGDAVLVNDNLAQLLLTSQDLRDHGHGQIVIIKGDELRLIFTTEGTIQVHVFDYRRGL